MSYEDELVAKFIPNAEQIIRGLVREVEQVPEQYKWCFVDDHQERCLAPMKCAECVLWHHSARGSDE